MGALDFLRGGTVAAMPDDGRVDALSEALRVEQENNLIAQESIADLELALEDRGWQRITGDTTNGEFSTEGLIRMATLCRLMAIKNPLIKRAIALRTAYIWGGSVQVQAVANGKEDGQQDVNAVLQKFMDDPANQACLFGQQAQQIKERALGTDGNVMLALFTMPTTGGVQVRSLPMEEFGQIVCNPDDLSERWFYRRTWQQPTFDPSTGLTSRRSQTAWYPDVGYRPASKPSTIGGQPVRWDAPIVHVRVNGLDGWQYGVPDSYAAIDWARAYKDFLEDWSKLARALSRFAWRTTTKGNKAQQVAAKLSAPPSAQVLSAGTVPNYAGATAVLDPSTSLEAIPKTGATVDAMSGKPLAMMVASAMDVPITMLLADPGNVGARATAETLDRPTELAMQMRREIWSDVFRTICGHVIDQAVLAPQGPLTGVTSRDEWGRLSVDLGDGTDRTVLVDWPTLDETTPLTLVQAIAAADATGKVPDLTVARLLLHALGVDDVDDLIEDMTDDDGNFVSPDASAGQQAVQAFRRGDDPAAVTGNPPPSDNAGGGVAPVDGEQQ